MTKLYSTQFIDSNRYDLMRGATHRRSPRCKIGLMFAGALAIAAQPASASFIRPVGTLPSATEDGLVQAIPPNQLNPTAGTVQFSNAQRGYFARADLGNGSLKGRAFVTQSGPGAGSSNVNPRYGETITFNSPGNDTWDFNFSLGGTVSTSGDPIPLFQDFGSVGVFQTTFAQFALHVFEGNTVSAIGTHPGNGLTPWVDELTNALFSEVKTLPLSAGTDPDQNGDVLANKVLSSTISGSVPLTAGINSFDIVAVLSVSGSVPSNLVSSFDLNFSNTAVLDIDSNVPFTSASGVFLTGQNRIPIPGTAVLLAVGCAGIGYQRRKRLVSFRGV